jgi:hypothetical protein
MRPWQNGTFCPLSASTSNFNPVNIQYIQIVEIFTLLEREPQLPFFKDLLIGNLAGWTGYFVSCTRTG